MFKFKQYDIVKKKCNYWGEKFEKDNEEDRLEKKQLYMIIHCEDCGYEIMSLESGNTEAWWSEDFLTYKRKGTAYEYELICRIVKEREEHEKHICQIQSQSYLYGIQHFIDCLRDKKYSKKEKEYIAKALEIILKKETEND